MMSHIIASSHPPPSFIGSQRYEQFDREGAYCKSIYGSNHRFSDRGYATVERLKEIDSIGFREVQ
jgi:hypothetical protein